LKVFRTPIGFHDAYVAAPSRKAALAAWGADTDLFASGSAELVTDPKLTAGPLAAPGAVVKLSRGTVADHLRAAGRTAQKTPLAAPEQEALPTRAKRQPPPKPRPSRRPLERAEAAIEAFESEAAADRAALDRREADLLKERKALIARHQRTADKLDAQRERVRERYEESMDRWRSDG
jgi:hypothetical protein